MSGTLPPNAPLPLSVTVLGEARELLSALRRNRRFGYLLSFTTPSQPAEHPLVKDVKSVRDIVRVPVVTTGPNLYSPLWADGVLIPPDALLNAFDPFLEVVKSRDASGIITGVALQSIDRIASRLIVLAGSKGLLDQYATVLSTVIDAAAACRFDATDPASDEVVLSRITAVIATVITSPALPFLSDASILRSVEACLGIASGRRRASELLKRTADAALINIFESIGHQLPIFSKLHEKTSPDTFNVAEIPSVFAEGVNGPVFGRALDSDSFQQHGPASAAVAVALGQLCSKMADPFYAQSPAERILGLQLISAFLSSAGASIRSNSILKANLLRDCGRAILRSLGLFQSPPPVIALAFTIAVELVHVLKEDSAAFLLALLERVYPYYISGFENVLPKTSVSPGSSVHLDSPNANGVANGGVKSGGSNGSLEGSSIEIDPVIREIGLESLAALLSTPGLLCVVYQLSDCSLTKSDVVQPLMKALGHASKTKRFRRRSKRLRASTSGTGRVADPSTDPESDDEDGILAASSNTESTRIGRASALLCAESILSVVDTISDRLKLEAAGLSKPLNLDESLLVSPRKARIEKIRLHRAAEVFNSSEKLNKAAKLLPMLREHGFVQADADSQGTVSDDLDGDVRAIVQFIKHTPGLNKEKLGVILGEPDNLSRRVLADYTATFLFKGRPFTESLRVYLESFRLPGEAQKIDRVVQSFANRYFAQNQPTGGNSEVGSTHAGLTASNNGVSKNDSNAAGLSGADKTMEANGESVLADDESEGKKPHSISVLKSADAAYVLSYSVVMLNTDQHNDSIRKKMVLDDFVKNCRGINDGGDLPKWFLAEVFNSIAAVEIRMSDEAGIGALSDLMWDEQVRAIASPEVNLPTMANSRVFDEELFRLSWEAGVVAANSILNEAGDANSVQKALEGFLSIARCSTSFRIRRPTDAVVSSLCTATTVRDGPLHGAVVRFGTDIKAQMASVALSGVSRQCGDWLQGDGWQALVAYFLRLHALCLLPPMLEQRVGGYGPELVGVQQEELRASGLVPGWWPSRTTKNGEPPEESKPKKVARPNGFLAALLGTSVGSDADSEDEDIEAFVPGEGKSVRRISRSSPYYVKMRTPEDVEAQELARKCIAGCRIEDVIINEAKVLQSSALQHLSNAIAKCANRVIDAKSQQNGNSEQHYDEIASESDRSVLNWSDIAPPSPQHDASTIAGVSARHLTGSLAEAESEYPSFSLTPTWDGAIRERDESKAREFLVAFCVDVLCELTLQNRDRLHVPWPALHGLIVRIIAPATHPSPVLERAVVALLRVGVRLMHRKEIRDDVLRGLNLLVRLPSNTAEALSVPIAAGVHNIVNAHGSTITSTSGWHAMLSIIENSARYGADARELGLHTLSSIMKERNSSDAVSSQTFAPLLDAILAYTSCSSIDVSIRALDLMYVLSRQISSFTVLRATAESERQGVERVAGMKTGDDELWSEYWGPLFLGFASSVRDPRGKVRNSALGVLERVIASGSSGELLSASLWSQALSTVVFPLMTQLFTSHGFLAATVDAEREAQKKLFVERNAAVSGGRGRPRPFSTSAGHDEQLLRSVVAACNRTRMRAVMLTSKTFLQHHLAISEGLPEEAFTELWIGVLEVFRVAIESGANAFSEIGDVMGEKRGTESDELVEHVPENVKNLLLVMCDCGLLTSNQTVRWNATFTLVQKFIPNIEEVIASAARSPLPKMVKDSSQETVQPEIEKPAASVSSEIPEDSLVDGLPQESVKVEVLSTT